jgi:hypothetical protein
MMQWWGDYLDAMRMSDGKNVVKLPSVVKEHNAKK